MIDATVASASPQRAETARTASSRESATVVLLTDSTRRYSARIAATARTETRKRESLTRTTLVPRPNRETHSTQRCRERRGSAEKTKNNSAERAGPRQVLTVSKNRLAGGPRGYPACPTKIQALAHQSGTDAFVCQPGDRGDCFSQGAA